MGSWDLDGMRDCELCELPDQTFLRGPKDAEGFENGSFDNIDLQVRESDG